MLKTDRRESAKQLQASMKRLLNDAQLSTLSQIESFGWELRFVRRPPFADPIPVVFDASGQQNAVLEKDGTLNPNHGLVIRP